MLVSFNSMNDPFHEVNVRPRTTMYRLVSVDLLRQLMERTGDGAPITGRRLARDAGIAHGTVGNLLTGAQETVTESTAQAIAHRLGVDLLVLFEPVCRATTTIEEYASLIRPVKEAS
jgi:transcriptional regulator with XRE-family HTH domain